MVTKSGLHSYKKSVKPLAYMDKEEFKPLPKTVSFADFETDGLGGDFIYGGLVGMESNEVVFYSSIGEFFNLVFNVVEHSVESEYSIVYFHNLEYDGRYIVDELIKQDISFEIINRCQRLMIIKIGQFSFVDSYALLMDSLKNLSRVFTPEWEKKTLDLNEIVFDPDNAQHLEYLTYDCLALKYVVIRCRELIYDTFGINAKYTTSSTALRAWQTTLNETLFRLSDEMDDFVRKSYSGGLVYVKKLDIYHDIHVFDFNSMYPSVMRDHKFPYGQAHWVTKYVGQGFYECTVYAKRAKFLFLNGYSNDGKKHARLGGTFKAWITDAEYELALELGYQIQIERGLVFDHSGYLFKEFVDMCERLRLAHGKDSVGTIVKYIQNSLYGKFGAKKFREKIVYSPDENLKNRTPFVDPISGEFQGLYLDIEATDESYMLPYLASYTTALARCKLVRAILLCGIDNVVYGDTDSLFVNEKGKEKLSSCLGETYGKIKLENTFKRVLIVAPKLYFGDNKKRAKGFPKHVIQKLEAMLLDNELQLVDGHRDTRVVTGFTSLNSVRSILRNGSSFNKYMHRSIPALPKEVLERIRNGS